MSVTAVCNGCNRSYNVSEKLYGKRVKCKQCGTSFQVPMPAGGAASAVAIPSYASSPYTRAPQRRATELDSASKWWLYGHGIAFGLPVLLLVVGKVFPSVALPGVMLGTLVGFVMLIWGNVGILLTAGRESAICVLLCLFVPFYSVYYIITRFDDVKFYLARSVGGLALVLFAAMTVPTK